MELGKKPWEKSNKKNTSVRNDDSFTDMHDASYMIQLVDRIQSLRKK